MCNLIQSLPIVAQSSVDLFQICIDSFEGLLDRILKLSKGD